ncbi:MAG: hypothetical protein A2010_15010, partial [Nitrospirae bacterium GWD2_57_9]
MRTVIRSFILALILSSFPLPADASWVPDRRKSQFETTFGYALFPYPYSLPGIGSGLGLVGGAMNIKETTTDVYGMYFGGDVTGLAAGVADFHLIPRNLILDLGYSGLTNATIQSYSERGMNTNKNDYTNVELGDMTYYGSRLTATFFDRRFEIYGAYYQGSSQLRNIRDRDGGIIVSAENAEVQRGHVTIMGTRLDLTDDYADPRRGLRIDLSRFLTPPRDSGPDFYVQDYNVTGYVPLGRRSTWAFNYFRSDAHVDRQGETDPAKIAEEQGLNCSDPALTAEEQQFCNDFISNTIANNTYGTSSSLGGFSRLRSYPNMRYKGAHTIFYGTEIRWNLTDESTPYDIFIMRDVRTSW